MKYNYEEIVKSINSIKDPGERKTFIEQILSELREEEKNTYSKKTFSREERLRERMAYLELLFMQRNILLKEYN